MISTIFFIPKKMAKSHQHTVDEDGSASPKSLTLNSPYTKFKHRGTHLSCWKSGKWLPLGRRVCNDRLGCERSFWNFRNVLFLELSATYLGISILMETHHMDIILK